MTPSKSKKALPSSTSMAFPEHPTTLMQWKTAVQRIKFLYLNGQLKQCSVQCIQLLSEDKVSPHPLHVTYLHFYSALSTEGIARSTHNLSPSKIQMLVQAKTSYQAAASSLYVPDILTDYPNSKTPSFPEPCSLSAALFTSSPTRSSSATGYYSTSPSSVDSDDPTNSESEAISKPSPLRIHSKTPPTALTPFPRSTNPYPHPFTTNLLSFAAMLTTHIAIVDSLIRVTQTTQANRAAGGTRQPSHGASEEARALDRKVRVERLRRDGWGRERFRPEKYEGLCERALEEL